MSDIALEAERAASQERRDLEADGAIADRIAEALFVEDKAAAKLVDRRINDALAERAAVRSYPSARYLQLVELVRTAWEEKRDAWRRGLSRFVSGGGRSLAELDSAPSQPEDQEDDVTIRKFIDDELEAHLERAGLQSVAQMADGATAKLVVRLFHDGRRRGLLNSSFHNAFYNHIRGGLIRFDWPGGLSLKELLAMIGTDEKAEEGRPLDEPPILETATIDPERETPGVQEAVQQGALGEGLVPIEDSNESTADDDQEELEEECVDPRQESTHEELLVAERPGVEEAEYSCPLCGCTDTDCSQCIEASGEPCSWIDLGDELPTICSRCLVATLQEAILARANQVEAGSRQEFSSRFDAEPYARFPLGPEKEASVITRRGDPPPVPQGDEIIVQGTWGSFSLRRQKGAPEAELFISARVTPATADRIAAIILYEKSTILG